MRPRFLYTEFRRIYGVVFRTLLHGEAKIYLLFVGTTNLFDANSCCGLADSMVCNENRSNYTQTKCSYNAQDQSQFFCFALSGWFSSAQAFSSFLKPSEILKEQFINHFY